MSKLLHRLVVVICCVALVACTSMRTIVDSSLAQDGSVVARRPALSPNDALTVTTRDGAQAQVHLMTASPEFIEVTQDSDQQLRRYALSDVVKIERREFSGLKTAFLVVAVASGLYAIAKAAAEASLASGL